MSRFEGRMREDSRGGWTARAKVIKEEGGQVHEHVLASPHVFRSVALCRKWLKKAADELLIEDVRIELESPQHGEPSLGKRADHAARTRLRAVE